MEKTAAFHTLGCKLNFAETSTISRSLQEQGFQRVSFDEPASVYVINTCSVTENADRKFKDVVRQLRNRNPSALLVATGCYAQLKPDQVGDVEGVDLVLGATEKFNLHAYLTEYWDSGKGFAAVKKNRSEPAEVLACHIEEADQYVGGYSLGDRTRAFLKVQDGCDYPCTYCTIPLARGISRSAPLEQLIADAREIVSRGVREIVLTGVNIGDYGKGEYGNKRHEHSFLDLMRALDQESGAERIRISSIEPNLLKDEHIDWVAGSQRFVPHFHIPLQSGSDRILRKMKRRYLTQLYRDRIQNIKDRMPFACIGVDVIVGFPGEDDQAFLETADFLKELPVSYLHVFTYSERDHTEAAGLPDSVPLRVRKERSRILRALSAKKKRAFYEQHLGSRQEVLFESDNRSGFLEGFSRNYLRVRVPFDPEWIGTTRILSMDRIDNDGFIRPMVDIGASDKRESLSGLFREEA